MEIPTKVVLTMKDEKAPIIAPIKKDEGNFVSTFGACRNHGATAKNQKEKDSQAQAARRHCSFIE